MVGQGGGKPFSNVWLHYTQCTLVYISTWCTSAHGYIGVYQHMMYINTWCTSVHVVHWCTLAHGTLVYNGVHPYLVHTGVNKYMVYIGVHQHMVYNGVHQHMLYIITAYINSQSTLTHSEHQNSTPHNLLHPLLFLHETAPAWDDFVRYTWYA